MNRLGMLNIPVVGTAQGGGPSFDSTIGDLQER